LERKAVALALLTVTPAAVSVVEFFAAFVIAAGFDLVGDGVVVRGDCRTG